ncbi:hypothetical protein PANT111_110003 [Pantoea brenneri]|uniref:Uncharacterized protein n=1 Tax=Pantoea brenneri TaxID=472694 RepID=A0AAX3J0W6_9GAMM|nr:hypothetical protein PANT111_110003 [Pantoea brenneri]
MRQLHLKQQLIATHSVTKSPFISFTGCEACGNFYAFDQPGEKDEPGVSTPVLCRTRP